MKSQRSLNQTRFYCVKKWELVLVKNRNQIKRNWIWRKNNWIKSKSKLANVAFSQYRKKNKVKFLFFLPLTLEYGHILVHWNSINKLNLHIQTRTHISHQPTHLPNRQPLRKKQTAIPFVFLYVPSVLFNLWQKLIDIPIKNPSKPMILLFVSFFFPFLIHQHCIHNFFIKCLSCAFTTKINIVRRKC